MSGERLEFKGSLIRGYAKWLKDNGYYDRVLSRASGAARSRLLDPPFVTDWVASDEQFAVLDAVFAVGGDALLRAMVRGSAQTGVLKLLEPLIQGVVRVFGRTPAAVLSRLPSIRKNIVRGVDFRITTTSDRSALVEAISQREPLSAHSALAWAASIESMCMTLGFDTVSTTHETSPDLLSVRIHVRW